MLVEIMCHSPSWNSSNWCHGEWIRNGGLQNVPASGACLRSTGTALSSNSSSLCSLSGIPKYFCQGSSHFSLAFFSIFWDFVTKLERPRDGWKKFLSHTFCVWMSELPSVWAWWKHSGSSSCTGVPLLLPNLGLSLPEFQEERALIFLSEEFKASLLGGSRGISCQLFLNIRDKCWN